MFLSVKFKNLNCFSTNLLLVSADNFVSEKASKQFLKDSDVFMANSFWEEASQWVDDVMYDIFMGACLHC